MRVDASKSKYHEHEDAADEFSQDELQWLRILLRRLRFLESKIRTTGGLAAPDANGGALYVEMEVRGLAFVLSEIGYLAAPEPAPEVQP